MPDTTYIIGQIMSIVAIILGFVSFQMHKRKTLLIVQIATTLAFCAHYSLIGAWAGFSLNAIGAVRNFAYYHRDKKWLSTWATPVVFAAAMLTVGFITWQGYQDLFYISSMAISSFAMYYFGPQNIRKSILLTSTFVLIYDIMVFSIGGIIYESVAIISSIIGIIVYIKKKLPNA